MPNQWNSNDNDQGNIPNPNDNWGNKSASDTGDVERRLTDALHGMLNESRQSNPALDIAKNYMESKTLHPTEYNFYASNPERYGPALESRLSAIDKNKDRARYEYQVTEQRESALTNYKNNIIEPFLQSKAGKQFNDTGLTNIGGRSYFKMGVKDTNNPDNSWHTYLSVDPATGDNPNNIGALRVNDIMVAPQFPAIGGTGGIKGLSPTHQDLQNQMFKGLFGGGNNPFRQISSQFSASDSTNDDNGQMRGVWSNPGMWGAAGTGIQSRTQQMWSKPADVWVDSNYTGSPKTLVKGQDNGSTFLNNKANEGYTTYVGKRDMFGGDIFQRSPSQSHYVGVGSMLDVPGYYSTQDDQGNAIIFTGGDNPVKSLKRLQIGGMQQPTNYGKPGEVDPSWKQGNVATEGSGLMPSGYSLKSFTTIGGGLLLGEGQSILNLSTQKDKTIWQNKTWKFDLPMNEQGEPTLDDSTRSFLQSVGGSHYNRGQKITINGVDQDVTGNWNDARIDTAQIKDGQLIMHGIQSGNLFSNKYGTKAYNTKADFSKPGGGLEELNRYDIVENLSGDPLQFAMTAIDDMSKSSYEDLLRTHASRYQGDLPEGKSVDDLIGMSRHSSEMTPFLMNAAQKTLFPSAYRTHTIQRNVDETTYDRLVDQQSQDLAGLASQLGLKPEQLNTFVQSAEKLDNGQYRITASVPGLDMGRMFNFRPEERGTSSRVNIEDKMARAAFGNNEGLGYLSEIGLEAQRDNQQVIRASIANTGRGSIPDNAVNLNQLDPNMAQQYLQSLPTGTEGMSNYDLNQAKLSQMQEMFGDNPVVANGKMFASPNAASRYSVASDTGTESQEYVRKYIETMHGAMEASSQGSGIDPTAISSLDAAQTKMVSQAGFRKTAVSGGKDQSAGNELYSQDVALPANVEVAHWDDIVDKEHARARSQGVDIDRDEIQKVLEERMKTKGYATTWATMRNPSATAAVQATDVMKVIPQSLYESQYGGQLQVERGQYITSPAWIGKHGGDTDADSGSIISTSDWRNGGSVQEPTSAEKIWKDAFDAPGSQLANLAEGWSGFKKGVNLVEDPGQWIKAHGFTPEQLGAEASTQSGEAKLNMAKTYNWWRMFQAGSSPLDLDKESLAAASRVVGTTYQNPLDMKPLTPGAQRLQNLMETDFVSASRGMGKEFNLPDTAARSGLKPGANSKNATPEEYFTRGSNNPEAFARQTLQGLVEMVGERGQGGITAREAATMMVPSGYQNLDKLTEQVQSMSSKAEGAMSVNDLHDMLTKQVGGAVVDAQGQPLLHPDTKQGSKSWLLSKAPATMYAASSAAKSAGQGRTFWGQNARANAILGSLSKLGARTQAFTEVLSKGTLEPQDIALAAQVIGPNLFPNTDEFSSANAFWSDTVNAMGVSENPNAVNEWFAQPQQQENTIASEPTQSSPQSTITDDVMDSFIAATQSISKPIPQPLASEQSPVSNPPTVSNTKAGIAASKQQLAASIQNHPNWTQSQHAEAIGRSTGFVSKHANSVSGGSQPPNSPPPPSQPSSIPPTMSGGFSNVNVAQVGGQDVMDIGGTKVVPTASIREVSVSNKARALANEEFHAIQANPLFQELSTHGLASFEQDGRFNISPDQAKELISLQKRVSTLSGTMGNAIAIDKSQDPNYPKDPLTHYNPGENADAVLGLSQQAGAGSIFSVNRLLSKEASGEKLLGVAAATVEANKHAPKPSAIQEPGDMREANFQLDTLKRGMGDLASIFEKTSEAGGKVTKQQAHMIEAYDKTTEGLQTTVERLKAKGGGFSPDEQDFINKYNKMGGKDILESASRTLSGEPTSGEGQSLVESAKSAKFFNEYATDADKFPTDFSGKADMYIRMGRKGKDQLSQAKAAGVFGDEGSLERATWDTAGKAMGIGNRLVMSHFALRNMGQMFIDPMAQDQQAYIQNQTQREAQISASGALGGLGTNSQFMALQNSQFQQKLGMGQTFDEAWRPLQSMASGVSGKGTAAELMSIGGPAVAAGSAVMMTTDNLPAALAVGAGTFMAGAAGYISSAQADKMGLSKTASDIQSKGAFQATISDFFGVAAYDINGLTGGGVSASPDLYNKAKRVASVGTNNPNDKDLRDIDFIKSEQDIFLSNNAGKLNGASLENQQSAFARTLGIFGSPTAPIATGTKINGLDAYTNGNYDQFRNVVKAFGDAKTSGIDMNSLIQSKLGNTGLLGSYEKSTAYQGAVTDAANVVNTDVNLSQAQAFYGQMYSGLQSQLLGVGLTPIQTNDMASRDARASGDVNEMKKANAYNIGQGNIEQGWAQGAGSGLMFSNAGRNMSWYQYQNNLNNQGDLNTLKWATNANGLVSQQTDSLAASRGYSTGYANSVISNMITSVPDGAQDKLSQASNYITSNNLDLALNGFTGPLTQGLYKLGQGGVNYEGLAQANAAIQGINTNSPGIMASLRIGAVSDLLDMKGMTPAQQNQYVTEKSWAGAYSQTAAQYGMARTDAIGGLSSNIFTGLRPENAQGIINSANVFGTQNLAGLGMLENTQAAVVSAYAKDHGTDAGLATGNRLSGQAQQTYGYLASIARYGGNTSQNIGALDSLAQETGQQFTQDFAVTTGDQLANSMYADKHGFMGSMDWRRSIQTGSRGGSIGMQAGYDEAISPITALRRMSLGTSRGFVRGDGDYSVAQLSSMNQVQMEDAVNSQQIGLRNYDMGQAQYQMQRQIGSITGVGLGALGQSSVFKNFMGGQFASLSSGLTEGHGQWYFEDQNVALGRAQQDWSMGQQGQQLGIQQQQMNLGEQQWNASYSLRNQQFQTDTSYQRQSMQINEQHRIKGRQWEVEDIAYNKNMSSVQFGFSMIDADEGIRYSTGRQRRDAMRHRDEAVVVQSMQMGHMDTEEERAKTREKWAEDQYTRDKTHFEQNVTYQKQSMELDKRYHDQNHQLELQNFDLTKQNYEKQKIFITEQRKLEDDQRQFNRAAQILDIAAAKESLDVHQKVTKTIDDLNGAMKIAGDMATKDAAANNYYAQTGGLVTTSATSAATSLASVVDQLKKLVGIPSNTGSPPPTSPAPVATNVGSYSGNTTYNTSGTSGNMNRLFADGGYTGNEPSGTLVGGVHSREWVVPEGGSLVLRSGSGASGGVSNDQMLTWLQKIFGILTQIHSDGGNTMINFNNANPVQSVNKASSLANGAWK